jgi:RNA processing factor Prp31
VSLAAYKNELAGYLHSRMHSIAPNLTELVGERMRAQLIMMSGSLTNLAKAGPPECKGRVARSLANTGKLSIAGRMQACTRGRVQGRVEIGSSWRIVARNDGAESRDCTDGSCC